MNLEAVAAARRHSHAFDEGNPLAERNTRRAMWLTVIMMVIEISGGWWFNSMAVLADGWHMSSHALALGLSVFAYACARRFANDRRFAFGTWKIEILGGYTSAILLLGVAGLMVYQSVERLFHPGVIHYEQAILIAIVGLAVNLLCAWWLRDHHDHDHGHGHGHGHGYGHGHGHGHTHHAGHMPHDPHRHDHDHDHDHHHDHDHAHSHHHHDLNQRSAYLHVLADAATSVLAIVALLGGLFFGAAWLDPVMGLVGAALVSVWAWGLVRQTGRVLLDAQMDAPVVAEVREAIEEGPWAARISDLHVWQVGRGKFACVVEVVAAPGVSAEDFRQALAVHEELVHVTVELVEAA
ncbi:CDF family Co(II)/Ni(II) efflux transporter DmeF [Pseudoxanthomonas indica]|uniref:Cation diffusion facilitator family transporter n=1 Tax=Pseudoxanthomonas indica TaxID=428993 RepID=A0A1T5KP59_9GAMM|nr:CDF family Co(II)/Ni(II) efflux transporter DmeF [Pseudoxanthomonas indica]GGD50562.1 metal transporter [Pseudoxanthomonas indica]SKC65477.1 cation diffusion facilitator family transporter [Pseudoxanthomonas indica]